MNRTTQNKTSGTGAATRSARLWKPWILLAALLMCAWALPMRAAANGPVPMTFFAVSVEQAPDNAYAVDFLLPEEKIPEEEYTECNAEALAEAELPPDCELVRLNADGFVSYMAHSTNGSFEGRLSDAGFEMSPQPGDGEEQSGRVLYTASVRSGYDVMTHGSDSMVRIALIDGEGHVLNVSEPFEVFKSKPTLDYSGIRYNAAEGTAYTVMPPQEPSDYYTFADHAFMVVFAFLFLGATALVTMVIEFILALLFRLKPALWTLPVNLVSNLLFNLLLVACCFAFSVPYGGFIAVGEAAVMLAEYGVYTKIYKDYTHRRVLIYSIAANVCSAVVVLLVTALLMG